MHIIFFQYVHENVASVNSWSFTFIQKKVTSARRTIYSIITVVEVYSVRQMTDLSCQGTWCRVWWSGRGQWAVCERRTLRRLCFAAFPATPCRHPTSVNTRHWNPAFTAGSKRAYVPLYWSSTACLRIFRSQQQPGNQVSHQHYHHYVHSKES